MFTKIFSANNEPSHLWKTNVIPVQKGKSKYKSSKMHQNAFVIIYWAEIVVSAISYCYVNKMIIGLSLRNNIIAFN